MKRFLITVAASALGFALAIGAVGFVGYQALVAPRIAEASLLGAPLAAELPPEIQGLHDLSASERFGHFYSAQLRFSDKDNQAHAVSVVPGTVTAVSDKSLTVKANDSSLGSKGYNLTAETRIHQAGGQPWSGGQGSQAAPKNGDQVVVVSLDNSNDARAVILGGPNGFRPHGGPFRRG